MAKAKRVTASKRKRPEPVNPRLAWMNALSLSLVLLSAFAVILSAPACRELYTMLQELESDQWYLQEDYGRLLLEQSTWASHYRVGKVARGELGMIAPQIDRLRVVVK